MATTTLRPDGDGSATAWTPLGAGTNFSEVDEAVADEDTSYNSNVGAFSVDRLTYPASGIAGGATVSQVEAFGRAKDLGGGDNRWQLNLRTGGSNYSSGSVKTLTAAYADYSYAWLVNPDTTNAWTIAEIDATEWGYQTQQNADGQRVTQAWIVITYTVAAAAPSGGIVPKMMELLMTNDD